MSLQRKYSSTAFFSHWLTTQPSAPGSATRACPLSSSDIARSTRGRSLSIAPASSVARASKAASSSARSSASSAGLAAVGIRGFSFEAGNEGVADCSEAGLVERAVVAVAELEDVLDAFAEGGDARIVHAQALRAQQLRDVGEQARAVGADQRQARALAAVHG